MTHERFTPARILAIAADLRLWLIGMLVWIVETLGQEAPFAAHLDAFARAELRRAEYWAKGLAVLLAYARAREEGAGVPQQRTHAPCADFRREPNAARALTRRLLPGTAGFQPANRGPAGSRRSRLSARAAWLRHFLDNIEAAADRVLARAERGFSVLGFALREALCAPARAAEQRAARPIAFDTS